MAYKCSGKEHSWTHSDNSLPSL